MRLNSNFALRQVGGLPFLVPVGTQPRDGIVTLSPAAAEIWTALERKPTYDAALSALLEQFDVPEETARRDLDAFLVQMRASGLLDPRAHDLTGCRFGRLTVLEPTRERNRGAVVWRCRCDCGREVWLESRKLRTGVVQSCGCAGPAVPSDLTGLRFGKLLVLGRSGNRAKDRNPLWKCRCDCGREIEAVRSRLITGGVSSCGCARTPPRKDWVGRRFGRVVVQAYGGKEQGKHYWVCQCDCGTVFRASQSNLQNGQTTSCGCRQREQPGLHFVGGTFVEGIRSKTLSKANTSGVRGVYFNKRRGKWVAQIMFKGKCYYLGAFSRLEDAAKARAKGEEMFDDFLNWYHLEYETKKSGAAP